MVVLPMLELRPSRPSRLLVSGSARAPSRCSLGAKMVSAPRMGARARRTFAIRMREVVRVDVLHAPVEGLDDSLQGAFDGGLPKS